MSFIDSLARRVRPALWVLVLAGHGLTFAASDPIPDQIAQLQSEDHGVRIQAVEALGRSQDRRAAEALVRLLDVEIDDVAQREELWLHLARALHRLAAAGLVGGQSLPGLERLARLEPTVTVLDTENFRAPREVPKFAFDYAAWRAANFIKLEEARRTITARIAPMPPEQQAAYLADEAWRRPRDDEGLLHLAALEELKRLGARGVGPSVELVESVGARSQAGMVDYFAEIYRGTRDPRCAGALLGLAASSEQAVWQPALLALRDFDDPEVVNGLIARLGAEGASDRLSTQLTIETLGRIGSTTAVPFLAELLGHPSRQVAVSASDALVAIGVAAVRVLIGELERENRQSRLLAARALARIDDGEGREALRGFLAKHPDEDSDLLREIRSALEGS